MKVQYNNTIGFGAFVTPDSEESMQRFRQYLSQKTGHIEENALGHFVIDQAKNDDIDLTFKTTEKGDFFAVYPTENPQRVTLIDVGDKYEPEWEKSINAEIKSFLKENPEIPENKSNLKQKLQYGFLRLKKVLLKSKNSTNWDILPDAMKKAGELATKMQSEFTPKLRKI